MKPDLEKTEGIIADLLLLIDKLNDDNNLLKTQLQESQASVNKTKGQSTTGESNMSTIQQIKPIGTPSAKTPRSPIRRSKSPVKTKTAPYENSDNSDETIVTNNHQHIKAFWEKRSRGQECKPIVETVEDKTVRCAINTRGSETPEPLRHLRTQTGDSSRGTRSAEVNVDTAVPMSPSSSSPVIMATIEQVTTNYAKVDPFILKQLMEGETTTTKNNSQKNIIIIAAAEISLQSQHRDISMTDGTPHCQSKRLDLDSEKDNGIFFIIKSFVP